nr:DNA helicase [Tanacetum cinerariifolium]
MDSAICSALSKATPSVFLDSAICSAVSGPYKPLLGGGYRSPQSNYSVGGKVVVLDFGNSRGISGTRRCTPVSLPTDKNGRGANVRWGQSQSQTDTVPFDSCIDRRGLDVICNKKNRTRSSSVGSGHHEAADGVNHGVLHFGMENMLKRQQLLRPHYHRCCGGGKVVCKWPREPPAGIKELFKNKGFQENIRAYNQMFAVTSFGACIEDSVNRRDSSQLDPEFVSTLIHLLDEHNELVRLFRTARDRGESGDVSEFHNRLFSVVGAREYDLLTLGAIMFENGPNTRTDYDVITESRGGFPQRRQGLNKRLFMNQYYMFQLHECLDWYALLFRGTRLFQQHVVGIFCSIEQNRLDYYRLRQNDIRREYLSGIYNAISRGDREGKCGKNFTKKFIEHTFFDADGYVHYRRRETHTCTSRRGVDLENGYIVPYNRWIAAKIVRQVGDPPADTNNNNRQLRYYLYILKVDHQPLTLIFNYEGKTKTTLTEWLDYNKHNGDGLHLTNIDFMKEFVWCKTFDDIRTVNKRLYLTFRAACEAFGLLGDDKEWHTALEEAAFSASNLQLRSLFVEILIFYDVADPMRLWKAFWRRMSDNVPRTISNSLHIQYMYMNDLELEGSVLYEVEDESPVNDRRCFEALDRTLRDVLDAPEKLFG